MRCHASATRAFTVRRPCLRRPRLVSRRPTTRPTGPSRSRGRKALRAAPVGECVQPAVGGGVRALARRSHSAAADENNRTSPGLRGRRLVQVPRAVHLWRPVAVDEFVGDVGQRGVLDHRGRVQHTAQRKAGGGRRRHQTPGGVSFRDVTALHHDIGAHRTDEFDRLQRLCRWLGAGVEHDPATAAPRPSSRRGTAQGRPGRR